MEDDLEEQIVKGVEEFQKVKEIINEELKKGK